MTLQNGKDNKLNEHKFISSNKNYSLMKNYCFERDSQPTISENI